MKKSFFSTVLCLVVWQIASAQVSFAPSVGMNYTNTLAHIIVISKYTEYAYVGGLVNIPIRSHVALQTAIQYSPKGQIWYIGKSLAYNRYKFNYLDILPSLEYSIGSKKRIGLAAGLNAGINLFEQVQPFGQNNWTRLKTPIMKPFDLGFLLGMKAYYKKLFFSISYNQSIINAGPIYTNEVGESQPTKTFNQNLQIGVGYFLTSTHN
jgi:Outer membrane protein beta-barrel domain